MQPRPKRYTPSVRSTRSQVTPTPRSRVVSVDTRRPVPTQDTCKTTSEREGNLFWGPAYWKTLHSIAASYDTSKRAAFVTFINVLPALLPCAACARHLKENLQRFPPTDFLGSRDDLFTWMYRLHDLVNRSKDNPSVSPPFNEVKQFYYSGIWQCEKCRIE
jgi:hypothetical protein